MRAVAFDTHIRLRQQRSETLEREHELAAAVDPDDAATAGHHQWLDHDRIRQRERDFARVVGQRNRPERRHRETARLQGPAAFELVAAGEGGAGRIAGQAECFVRSRGNRHGTIAHRDHAVRRMLAKAIDDSLDRSELVMKTDRNRLIPPRIVQLVAAVARKDETHTEFFGRLAE